MPPSDSQKKDVIYAVVGLKRKVLADYSEKKGGSFTSFTDDILKKISNSEPGKYCIDYENFQYMYLKDEKDKGLVFILLVESGYKKETGFGLLMKMRTTFCEMFTEKRIKNAKPYSLSKEFNGDMKNLIKVYSIDSYDKVDVVINQFEDLKSQQ